MNRYEKTLIESQNHLDDGNNHHDNYDETHRNMHNYYIDDGEQMLNFLTKEQQYEEQIYCLTCDLRKMKKERELYALGSKFLAIILFYKFIFG